MYQGSSIPSICSKNLGNCFNFFFLPSAIFSYFTTFSYFNSFLSTVNRIEPKILNLKIYNERMKQLQNLRAFSR
jgi:hypothetical protein